MKKIYSTIMITVLCFGLIFMPNTFAVTLDTMTGYLAVNNGDFSNSLTGWTFTKGTDIDAKIITDTNGTYLEVSDLNLSASIAVFSSLITIPDGTENDTYKMEFRTKYTGNKISVGLRPYDSDGVMLSSGSVGQSYGASPGWINASFNFVPNKLRSQTYIDSGSIVKGIKINFYTSTGAAAATSCFDDIKIYNTNVKTKELKTPIFANAGGSTIDNLTQDLSGQNIDVKVDVVDDTTISRKIVLLSGLYDKDNKQVDFAVSDNSDVLNGNTTIINSLAIPNADLNGYHAMAMVWNDLYEMLPYDNATSLPAVTPISPAQEVSNDIKIDINGTKFTVSGAKNAGDKITLIMLKNGKTPDDLKGLSTFASIKDTILHSYQTTVDISGKYIHNFVVEADTPRGDYTFMISGNGYTTPQIINKFFPGADAAKKSLELMNSSETVQDIKDTLAMYGTDFNWPIDRITALDSCQLPSGNSFIYEYLLNLQIPFNTTEVEAGMQELNKQFEIAIQLCKINFAQDTTQLENLLKENTSLLNLNLVEFNKASSTDARKIIFLNILNEKDLLDVECLNTIFQENFVLTFVNDPKDWNEIKTIIESAQTYIGFNMGIDSQYSKVDDKPRVFKLLLDKRPFLSLADIKNKADAIVESLLLPKPASPSVVRPSSGGGGGTYKISVPEKTSNTVMKNSLSLFVNRSIAYVKGEKKSLESSNPNITAKVIEGRTLVPVRFLAENFGAKVDWDDVTKTATITLDNKIAKITLNKQEVLINNETVPLDVPATTIDGRTMLPLRVFCEKVMGKVVFWDDRGLIVISDNEVLKKDTDKDTIDGIVSMFK